MFLEILLIKSSATVLAENNAKTKEAFETYFFVINAKFKFIPSLDVCLDLKTYVDL